MTEPDQPSAARPDVVATRRVHEGWVNLRVDSLRYPSGHESTAEVVEHPGGIVIVAFDSAARLLLVRQYRHPAGRELLELPAGTLEPDEAPELCAERELQEETGYRPGRLERLGGFYTAPGFCDEYLHAFLALDLVESRLQGDEEAIDLEAIPLDEAHRMIASGQIEDAKTAGALFLYALRQGKTWGSPG